MQPHSHSSRCLGISTQLPSLPGYLVGAIGTVALLAAPQAEAAVTQVSFGFGSVLDNTTPSNTNTSVGGFGTLREVTNSQTIVLGNYDVSSGGALYQDSGRSNSRGHAAFFNDGTVIGATAAINSGYGHGTNGYLGGGYFLRLDGTVGENIATSQINKNIGFMTGSLTGTHYWGWANVSWNATSQSLAFNSVYVESTPNTPITVGDTGISAAPEPSRALLALAGLAGVALRRRRKQAA